MWLYTDTDQGDHPNFGVPLSHKGIERPYNELVESAIAVIIAQLGDALYPAYAKRLLFAIAVHSMESWLLLYFFDRDEPKNSMDRLVRQLVRQNKKPLVKETRAYRPLARGIKRKRLMVLSVGKHSLGLFLVQLCGFITPTTKDT
jgi:hypothetical protein